MAVNLLTDAWVSEVSCVSGSVIVLPLTSDVVAKQHNKSAKL